MERKTVNLSNLEAIIIAQRLERAKMIADYEHRKKLGYFDLPPVTPAGRGPRTRLAGTLVALALRLDRRSVLAAGH